MIIHDYKLYDLIIKTVIPVTILWTLILYFAFYERFSNIFNKKEQHIMTSKVYLILLFLHFFAFFCIVLLSMMLLPMDI